jgi:hypothetical protein
MRAAANAGHAASYGSGRIGHRADHRDFSAEALLDVARRHGRGNGDYQRFLIQLRGNFF